MMTIKFELIGSVVIKIKAPKMFEYYKREYRHLDTFIVSLMNLKKFEKRRNYKRRILKTK